MPDKLDKSRLWSVDGTLAREDGGVIEEDAIDAFIAAFCVLAESHGLGFNGGWSSLTQAQIDGEDDA